MDWLENELKQALDRKQPSPGFDARVKARVDARIYERLRPKLRLFTMPRWVAAAAVLIVIVSAGEGYRWRRGQAAKEQVMLAMRITGGTLNRVQMQMKGNRP
jgi:hypothetical protein